MLRLDEPFNWSRANNRAVAGSTDEILLFLNNDTEMLTQSWDDRLRDRLGSLCTGAVGGAAPVPRFGRAACGRPARPTKRPARSRGDRRRQQRAWAAGPLDHAAPRIGSDGRVPCGCVWITFAQIGGFDEKRLFVAYNDVDLCLRLREAGFAIVYDPLIELIHHESRSRGMAVTRAQIAWDHAERDTLHKIWGQAMIDEPSYNPHWPVDGVPFDGLREPTPSQILAHIRSSDGSFPWRVVRAEAQR